MKDRGSKVSQGDKKAHYEARASGVSERARGMGASRADKEMCGARVSRAGKEMRETRVSRAGQKLADAAEAFGFDFRGKTVLDIGSSTGGFTEYALTHGAERVIAIEKGTGQMVEPLRHDPRVELHEKVDIFDCQRVGGEEGRLGSGETGGQRGDERSVCALELGKSRLVILADVSFVSLRKVLLHVKRRIAAADTEYLVMLKPQFEAEAGQLVNGVLKNEKMRREVIRGFEFWLKENGFVVMNKRDNQVAGKRGGNVERFYLLRGSK